MIKYTNTRLMFPEPADSGNGAAPEEKTGTAAPPAPAEEAANPFDFQQYMGEENMETPQEEPTPEPEYTLGFTEEDGLEAEDVAFFTDKAKELNLPADGATEFVRALGKMLSERDTAANAEEEKALRQEWGKDFDAKAKQVGAFMGRTFAALKLTREQVMDFATPAHYRVFHHLMKQSSEKAAVAVPAALTPQQKSAKLQELSVKRVQLHNSNDDDGAELVKDEINRISWEKYGCKAYN